MNVERITEMEGYLNDCTKAASELKSQLSRMEELRQPMIKLFSYYGSADWYEDREGELPKDVPAGVLSEDAVYDQITEARDAAFQMLELATDILKNRI